VKGGILEWGHGSLQVPFVRGKGCVTVVLQGQGRTGHHQFHKKKKTKATQALFGGAEPRQAQKKTNKPSDH